MKKYLIILIIIVACFIGYILYEVSTFELLPVEEKFLIEFSNYSGAKYKVFFVGGNATTEDVVQIRKIMNSSVEIIANIEGYNAVESTKLLNDSLLQLIVNDIGYATNLPDTVIVNLNSKNILF